MATRSLVRSVLIAAVVAACGAQAPESSVVGSATATARASQATASTPRSASPSASAASGASASADAGLRVVAVGDSIPFNDPGDCPGCTGFVERYADALADATGKSVSVRNMSAHDNHTIDGLLSDLASNKAEVDALTAADAIIVGIAHNDVPMNRDDDACDGAAGDDPAWAKFTDECIATEVVRFTPKYTMAFEQIAALRAGKPTILLALDRYNDWIGWPSHDLPPEGAAATTKVIAAWNAMLCGAAEANGFTCADVSKAFNGASGTDPSGDLLASDYTHPSDKGNEVIAKLLIDQGFAPLAQ